jgi:hypothetical protein
MDVFVGCFASGVELNFYASALYIASSAMFSQNWPESATVSTIGEGKKMAKSDGEELRSGAADREP